MGALVTLVKRAKNINLEQLLKYLKRTEGVTAETRVAAAKAAAKTKPVITVAEENLPAIGDTLHVTNPNRAVVEAEAAVKRADSAEKVLPKVIKGVYADKELIKSCDDIVAEIEAMPEFKEWDSVKDWGSRIVCNTGRQVEYDQKIYKKVVTLKDGRNVEYKLTKYNDSETAYKSVTFLDSKSYTKEGFTIYTNREGKIEHYSFFNGKRYTPDGNLKAMYRTNYRNEVDYEERYSNYLQQQNGNVQRECHLFADSYIPKVLTEKGRTFDPWSFSSSTKQLLNPEGKVIAEIGNITPNAAYRITGNTGIAKLLVNGKPRFVCLSEDGRIILQEDSDIALRSAKLLDGTPVFTDNASASIAITPELLGFVKNTKGSESLFHKIVTKIFG